MSDRVLTVTFLDVGQGDATIILPPDGEGDPVVFDCGRDGWVVTQQLRSWNVERIEAVIASHLDLDHVGGMATLLDAYAENIKAVYFPVDRDLSDEHEDAVTAKRLADRVRDGEKGESSPWEVRLVHRDSRPVCRGADWTIDVLAPRAGLHLDVQRGDDWFEPNRYSAVVRVQMADKTVLVGGDAPIITWSEVPVPLSADVFRVPHHGGSLEDGGVPDEWSVARLYDEVDPRLAVLSVGTNNRYDHPKLKWLEPLIGRSGCRLLCTQVTGRCHPAFERGAPEDQRTRAIAEARSRLPQPYGDGDHFSEPPWRHYMRRTGQPGQQPTNIRTELPEVPCAGTISVRIDEHGDVEVDPSASHASLAARIGRWSNPMCRRG